ncbi:Voltage-dependent anion channel [Rhizoctonia solani]|uniref:Voltage-dependent anion channel n=1 Tax=Rhizoctonia solani TaxID=456999 RepID=A0A8H7IE94_9AGAM|nr:Voltage-dependent anion channel [Rhizoctonia solani]
MTHGHSEPELPYHGPKFGGLAKRVHGWSWQAFPIGMGTGAVYVLLSALDPHPEWVTTVEVVFFFLALFLFALNISTLALQGILYREQSKRLLFDPVKGVFVPLCVLSFATLIIGTIQYAVPVGIIHPGFIYELFCPMTSIHPAWAFLIFPMMLVGVVHSTYSRSSQVTDPRCIGVLLVGYVFQGLGFFMTFFYLAIYILRIMTTGFMDGHQANGAFVACGPPGFTALALINLGKQARIILPAYNLVSPQAGEIFFAASVMGALLLFGLAVFFFFFGILPYWFKLHKHLSEILGCWALTFPNVGWINTLRALGDIFGIKGFSVWHAIMTFLVCMVWLILFGLTILAFVRGKIFLAKDADVWRDTMSGDDAARNAASQVAPGLVSEQSSVVNLPYTAPRFHLAVTTLISRNSKEESALGLSITTVSRTRRK